MEKKHAVINKHGQKVWLNDAALKIAEKHFGIERVRAVSREVPIELLKLPKKIDIIKAEVKVVKPVIVAPEVTVKENLTVPIIVPEVEVIKRRKTKKQ